MNYQNNVVGCVWPWFCSWHFTWPVLNVDSITFSWLLHYLRIYWASRVALVVKNSPANAGDTGDMGLIPGSGRFPWRRAWQLTPVFLPGESHGQRITWDYKGLHGGLQSLGSQSQTWLKWLSMQACVLFSLFSCSSSLRLGLLISLLIPLLNTKASQA